MTKKKLLSLILAICMVMSLAPTIASADGGNAPETHTVDFGTGSWTVGEQTVTADKTGTIDAMEMDAEITITGFNADTMQAQLVSEDGFTATLTVVDGKTSLSAKNCEGLPDGTLQFSVVAKSTGGQEGNNPGGDENGLSIELCGNLSHSVSNGTFTYDHGTARVMFVRGSSDGAYDGSETRITLTDDVTAVKIILTADDGYQGGLATGGNNPPVPDPEVNDRESTYTFERSAMEEAGNFVAFNIEFIGESGGDAPITWHTVSWGGGNVTVEHGTVAAERIHLGDKIFTVNLEESDASDSDNIYPIDDIIGEEGQEGLGEYGLGYGDTDLFIDDSVNEDVSIDFKFVPDCGYQLSDILTNETESLLGDFTASISEISIFNFEVRHDGGNVHFNVVFAAAEDTIDVTSNSVTDASIANGENATDSGNLKMTIVDIQEDAVSEELKVQAGESAMYLNMNLYQVVSKGGENGNWENQLEDLSDAITVTLSVPAPAEGSAYYIVREHGDGDNKTYDRIEVTYVPDESDSTMGTVMFETDKFSNYALGQMQVGGDIHTHTLTLVPAKDSTCTGAGNKAYYTCDGCGKWFEDANGAVEITDKSSVIIEGSKAAHSYGDDNVCDICGYTKPVTPSSYSIIEGANSSWTKNTDGTLTFRANGDFSKFIGVKVDGTLIDAKNYTAVSGSTIVTLKADYLKTLSNGTHSLTVLFNGGECSTNFEIIGTTNPLNSTGPQTGDDSNLALWFVLMCISCSGAVGTIIYSRKKKYSAK